MFDIITDRRKDPLGAMMLDYLEGNRNAFVEVESPTLEMWLMDGRTMFRDYREMDELEKRSLQLCKGKILDVGAGSGCHSLFLQENGHDVDAIDVSPGCVEVMKRRGVRNVFHKNLFSMNEQVYSTILMLMNGLGICGTLEGCNLFFQFAKSILAEDGQILAESTSLEPAGDEPPSGSDDEGYSGETEFVMKYRDIIGDPFPWIYADFPLMQTIAAYNGLRCEKVSENREGRYVMLIFT